MTTPLNLAEVKSLAERGQSVRQIASALGSRYCTVYQFTRRHGIVVIPSAPETGRQKKLTQEQINQIVRASVKGEGLRSLSARFSVTLGTIQWHLRRARQKKAAVPDVTNDTDRKLLEAIKGLAKQMRSSPRNIAKRIERLHRLGSI